MKTLSLIFALAFVVAAPSLAGSPHGRLPGVGTFAYNGLPVVTAAPQQIAALVRDERTAFGFNDIHLQRLPGVRGRSDSR